MPDRHASSDYRASLRSLEHLACTHMLKCSLTCVRKPSRLQDGGQLTAEQLAMYQQQLQLQEQMAAAAAQIQQQQQQEVQDPMQVQMDAAQQQVQQQAYEQQVAAAAAAPGGEHHPQQAAAAPPAASPAAADPTAAAAAGAASPAAAGADADDDASARAAVAAAHQFLATGGVPAVGPAAAALRSLPVFFDPLELLGPDPGSLAGQAAATAAMHHADVLQKTIR